MKGSTPPKVARTKKEGTARRGNGADPSADVEQAHGEPVFSFGRSIQLGAAERGGSKFANEMIGCKKVACVF